MRSPRLAVRQSDFIVPIPNTKRLKYLAENAGAVDVNSVIAMKALEKDRTRRYETANGLAMDVKRFLENEPVSARPPSKLYKFQKTVRRNRRSCLGSSW